MTAAATLALLLAASPPIGVRWQPGTLHGFPSLSDTAGAVVADGELTQEVRGEALLVHLRWSFADGRRVDELDEFRAAADLAQRRFTWIERSAKGELRRFEVDFMTGRAVAVTRDDAGELHRDEEQLDLPRGRAFTGYGTAMAVAQLGLSEGDEAELTFVAFTPKPRTVALAVRRDREERVAASGRGIRCDHYTLHPKIPFPISLFAGARDGQLWFTHEAPPALVRAEQNLVAKDDPVVVVDVTPRGAARAAAARRGPATAHPRP